MCVSRIPEEFAVNESPRGTLSGTEFEQLGGLDPSGNTEFAGPSGGLE